MKSNSNSHYAIVKSENNISIVKVGSKALEHMNKIEALLTEKHYCKAKEIAQKCRLGVHTVYRCIKVMRMQGKGILPNKQGYVLSKYAKKSDDLFFVRRVAGRRMSDMITFFSAQNDIINRWSSTEDRKIMKTIMEPLVTDMTFLNNSMEAITKTYLKI